MPRAVEIASRIESDTSSARLELATDDTLRPASDEADAFVVPSPVTEFGAVNTDVTLPPA